MPIDTTSTPPVSRGFSVHGVHFRIIGSASSAAAMLVRKSEVYRLVPGRNTALNAETVFDFVRDRLGPAP